jgi:lipoprotein-releasing system permease protein
MYKLLLCWRYLRTRYLALVCVVSVMLGVATLIVVNSVMAGFSTKLKERLHGILADVSIEAYDFSGFADPEAKMKMIAESPAGQYIEAMSPVIETVAMMQYNFRGSTVTKMVKLVGVDPVGRAKVGGFGDYLCDMNEQRMPPSFQLSETAQHRLNLFRVPAPPTLPATPGIEDGAPPPPEEWQHDEKQVQGAFVGHAIAHFRHFQPDGKSEEVYTLEPGDTFTIICPGGAKLTPEFDRFAVAGYFRSEMSEYDANHVFVPLDHLQRLRGMQGRATAIQIKLTDFAKAKFVVEELKKIFPIWEFQTVTWQDKQGPLLAAIDIERGILNVLLFLIVGVAGFGILAIFSMIVIEKTRDIGVLKALGASNRGVMGIFLGYGLLLGVVGAVLGTGLGLLITTYLNEIEATLSSLTGHEVFNRKVYYFESIPTFIQTSSVFWINVGSILIAAVFSVLPALKAARLQPVRALRFE